MRFRGVKECGQPLHIEADVSLLKSLGWKQQFTLEAGLEKEISIIKEELIKKEVV